MRRLALLLVALPAVAAAEPTKPRLAYGTADASEGVTITWNTQDDLQAALVELRAGGAAWERHEATTEHWDDGGMYVHAVELADLQPDTEYTYRVGDGQAWSTEYTFITGPADRCAPFRFVLLGDGRSQDEHGPSHNWDPILTEALGHAPAFALNGGDIVKDGDQADQWFNFLDMTDDMLATIPHLPTIGNHDDGPVDGDGAHYNVLFTLPRNEVSETEDYYFFTFGDMIVVSLSTQTFRGNNFADQGDWLDRVLTDVPRRWKVVFLHHPIYTSTLLGIMHEPNEQGQNGALVPVFDRHHVDLVLAGHNHWYQRFSPSCGGGGDDRAHPVDSEADGTVYVTSGGAGSYTADIGVISDILLGADCLGTPGCAVLRGEHHYMVFDVEPNRISVRVEATAAQNWGESPDFRERLDEFVVEKAGDERVDCAVVDPGEGEGEGEPPAEGEGEGPAEGEGEPPAEGEGEPPAEGEGEGAPPAEGEGEGAPPAEGEGEGAPAAEGEGEGEGPGPDPDAGAWPADARGPVGPPPAAGRQAADDGCGCRLGRGPARRALLGAGLLRR